MKANPGRPFSPVEAQVDMMKSHVTRGVSPVLKSNGGRTLLLAVPATWTEQAFCLNNWEHYDESVGLKPGQAAARCGDCPVIAECLSAAMDEERGLSAGNRYAVRGGLSPKERALLDFADRECKRGHRGRWAAYSPTVCLECKAEDERVRSQGRAAQLVSCLGCRTEMRVRNFPRHLETVHAGERAA